MGQERGDDEIDGKKEKATAMGREVAREGGRRRRNESLSVVVWRIGEKKKKKGA